jgi:hypothetical protein
MSHERGAVSGRLHKSLLAFLTMLALAVALPAVVLAAGDGGARVPSAAEPELAASGLAGQLFPGSWLETERWGSLLNGGGSGSGLHTSTVAPVPFFDDMESGSGNWTATGDWAITTEWYTSPTHCWSDSPYADYLDNSDTSITSTTIDLSQAAANSNQVILIFDLKIDSDPTFDCLWVEISGDDGDTWHVLDWPSGHGEGYLVYAIPTEHVTNQFKVRFALRSDDFYDYDDGVFIDDVAVLAAPDQWVEQNDPKITYLGSWSTVAQTSASGGSVSCTSARRDAATVRFTGTGLTWYATTGPGYGIAEVSVDGGPAETVDLYSSTISYEDCVFDTGNLTDGPHNVVIKCTGTKRTAATATTINLDGFEVWGSLTQAPKPAVYQQNDSRFKYIGSWSTVTTASASGGSLAASNAPGSAMNVSFNGTYVALYATKGPGYGKAQVSLDGGAPALVDLYSATDKYKQRVYTSGLLGSGPHTLSIYWIGQKSTASSGYKIDIDAFDFLGTVTTAPAPKPILWRYQENDVRLTYLGAWSTGTSSSASGGSFISGDGTGAAALVNFTGTSVQVIARKAPWYGKASISLDGGTGTVVDLYSASTLYNQSVYNKTGLASGAHTLTIKRLGQKNAAAMGYAISLDALPITGTLTQAAKTTVYQQDYAKVRYAGTWTKASSASASGGTYASGNVAGAKITLTFAGTYLTWFAKTAPWYGKAKVTLDGGTPVTVDLYSSAEAYKKQVYSTGLLAKKQHTLVIQWTGTKRTGSWGTAISADAFGVLGSLN